MNIEYINNEYDNLRLEYLQYLDKSRIYYMINKICLNIYNS